MPILFKTLCQFLTHNERYSWFYLDKSLVDTLSQDELDLVYIESAYDIFRIWYPKDKFFNRQLSNAELKLLMIRALEKGDIEEVIRLKGKIK